MPCVIKLDGLAEGKGVWICETEEEAFRVIDGIFDGTLIPPGYIQAPIMRGLWLLPSRRRLGKLAAFFQAAMDNGISTPGAVLVQKDELIELKAEYDKLVLPKGWSILPTTADGMGDKYREVWPAVKDLGWIGIACDDLRPCTPWWDRAILTRVNGKNVVSCNDGQQGNARMAGITIFSGGLLRAIGYIYPPGFWHTCVDDVWEDIGRSTGCWDYEPDVLVKHDHPFVNQQIDPNKADDTTLRSYGQTARDSEALRWWRQTERAGVLERVKALTDEVK